MIKVIKSIYICLLSIILVLSLSTASLQAEKLDPYNVTVLGSISDENGKNYNGFVIKITKGKETLCSNISEDKYDSDRNVINSGIIYMQCPLLQGQKYTYGLYTFTGKELYIKDFIVKKDLYTVGTEDYNDIKVGIYSKDNNIALFSQDYKQIQDQVFEKMYKQADGGGVDETDTTKYYDWSFNFLCKDIKREVIEKHFVIKNNKGIILQEAINNGASVTFEKDNYGILTYYDKGKLVTIDVNKNNSQLNVILSDCNDENSRVTIDKTYTNTTKKDISQKKIVEGDIVYKEIDKEYNNTNVNNENYIDTNIKKENNEQIKQAGIGTLNNFLIMIFALIIIIVIVIYKRTKSKKNVKDS